jgi:PAS domain S-box-containing protein
MNIGSKIGIAFALGLVVILAVGGIAYLNTQRLIEAHQRVIQTHEVQEKLDFILSAHLDAETGQRGFIITGEERYLEPYNAAIGRIQQNFDALADLIRDNPAQQKSLQQIREMSDAKIAELRETIQPRRESGLPGALPIFANGRGKKIMDDLRGLVDEMKAREQTLLDERTAAAEAWTNRTFLTIVLWTPLMLVVLAVVAVVMMRMVRYEGPAPQPRVPGQQWASIAMQYGFAVAAVAVASVLRWRLEASFGPLPLFITFYPAVLLVASIAGGGPGVATTVLSSLAADYWFIPPLGLFRYSAPNDVLALGIFTGANLFLCFLGERVRRARWAEAFGVAEQQRAEELSRQNDTLARQSDELTQQAEELSRQAEELSGRNEELQAQAEEIQTLNAELTHREDLLQSLLDATRMAAGEKAAMRDICNTALSMFGAAVATVAVYEKQDEQLLTLATAGLGDGSGVPHSRPTAHTFASLVINEKRTACLHDTALRPDLSGFQIEGKAPFRAVLGAPMRTAGQTFGAVVVYSDQPQQWTAEQFRLAEWLAGQCAHILETLRLQRQNEFLASVVKLASLSFGVGYPNGTLGMVNDAFEQLTGYTEDELRAIDWAKTLTPPEWQEIERKKLEELNRSGQPVLYEKEYIRKDGSRVPIELLVHLVKNAEGKPQYYFSFITDITERKRAQTALQQAKTTAEEANEAKGRFLANVSHELRTPMNAILGMVDLALQKTADRSAQDFLGVAKESADLLLTLLNDLLDSAKIESGKLTLESAPFSLRRVLDQTAQVLVVRASEKGIPFSYNVPDEVPDALVGDQIRLRQILLNLAGNGIKFTERGEVTVNVSKVDYDIIPPSPSGRGDWGEGSSAAKTGHDFIACPHPNPLPAGEGTVTLEFVVRDTGIGISPTDLQRIFLPFDQADASTTRRFGGTGLGLAISSSLVAMMNGRIWVESEEGKGSTFHFTVRLPLAEQAPVEPEIFEVPKAAPAQLRILLVEDNPANQKLAAYILKDRGHAVDIADCGQRAIQMVERGNYDLILMDVQMPGMDGLEATAAIRAAEKGSGPICRNGPEDALHKLDLTPFPPPVPIIAMTAHAMQGDRERCLAAGMDGYLSKPINAGEMISLVESLAMKQLGIRDGGLEKRVRDQGSGTRGRKSDDSSCLSDSEPRPPIPNPQSLIPPFKPQPPIPLFNPDLALKRCFNNQKMLKEMIQCFFEEVDVLFPLMHASLGKGDLIEFGRLGHRLKGTIIYLGAEPAREAALAVEKFEQHGGPSADAQAALKSLEHACKVLKSALTAQQRT